MHLCGLSPLFDKVSFLHFLRFCARCVCPLVNLTIVIAFPPAELPAFIGTMQSSDSLFRVCPPYLLSLVRHTHVLVRQNRVSRVAVYTQSPTCHALRPRGGACNSPAIAAHAVGFRTCKSVALSHLEHFEAQSLQLTLTACWFVPPVLNLWDYSRRPRVHFPADG